MLRHAHSYRFWTDHVLSAESSIPPKSADGGQKHSFVHEARCLRLLYQGSYTAKAAANRSGSLVALAHGAEIK